MPTLLTTRPLRYNNREMTAGQEFTASDRDARLLVALRRATPKPPEPVVPPAPPERTKRAYRRRDMVAEDRAVVATPIAEVPLEVVPETPADDVFRGASSSDF